MLTKITALLVKKETDACCLTAHKVLSTLQVAPPAYPIPPRSGISLVWLQSGIKQRSVVQRNRKLSSVCEGSTYSGCEGS